MSYSLQPAQLNARPSRQSCPQREEPQGRIGNFMDAAHSARNGMTAVGITSPDQEKTPAPLNPLTF